MSRNKKNTDNQNTPAHLGLSILEMSKAAMFELWYD